MNERLGSQTGVWGWRVLGVLNSAFQSLNPQKWLQSWRLQFQGLGRARPSIYGTSETPNPLSLTQGFKALAI